MSSSLTSESDSVSDSSFTSPPTTPRDSPSDVADAVSALGDVPRILRGLLPVMSSDVHDKRDVGTPDEWVQRDPRLIRLTGKV